MRQQRTWAFDRKTIAATGVVLVLLACSDGGTGPAARTLRGADVSVGDGLAHIEMVIDGSDNLTSISAVFNDDALDNLPTTMPATVFDLPLPANAPAGIIQYATLNWNPQGHPPPAVYTVPHFDVHFYFIPKSEVATITPADPDFAAKGAKAPPADELPPGYVGDPVAVPQMGTHYMDAGSHEFHGDPFTNTFVYGFYDGTMIFLEPMMTHAFLESRQGETKSLAIPAKYPAAGRYPTSYSVTFDAAAGGHRVTLDGFTERN